ncbi:MAG TPA: excinuclease ABC subunit UvrC [Luteibaculaceae bacterium]|nr:excinuclease ABC subunit UvrC [Luteibaculaceae bacterium]
MVSVLPQEPGVYQYYDSEGAILYIGKAKNLKKRVSSYFTKTHDSARLNLLVRRIADIKYIVVKTEYEALLLENSLIKEHQPRYNINLKDDKTYPWICIKNERFPRIFSTRRVIKDGSLYFGPYASGKTIATLLELGKRLFKPRTCNYVLSDENISKGKFRVCLEYHIGNCLGACEGKQSDREYRENIQRFKEILKGEISSVKKLLKADMQDCVDRLDFEGAHEVKEKLMALENYQAKSTVVNPLVGKVDVCTAVEEGDSVYVNFMRVSSGCVVQSHTVEVKRKMDESAADVLLSVLVELRQRFESDAQEVLVPFDLDVSSDELRWSVPVRGDKKQLLSLSQQNARAFLIDQLKHQKIVDPDRHLKRISEQMQRDLRLTEPPLHIECFDNSNIQGTHPVSACVVFKNLKPSKKDYRHFNIKTVEGPNDFASMEEVVYRRYSRMIAENEPLPNLIVIDGGKGQLSSALKSLTRLGLRGKVAIIGIAKRLEELYYPGDPLPLYLDKKSESLKIIQQLRDEAHRFGLTHHRQKRSKGALSSAIDEVKGIGEQTKKQLFAHFKTLSAIKTAPLADLAAVVGNSKAQLIRTHFGEKTAESGDAVE